ncbi:MAG: GTPase ObgE [Acidimicrobiales bacterium]
MPGFVDEAQVHVKAGNGGAGAVSFRREAHVSKGGPDGGDGGDGGDVYLEASNNVVSLIAFEDHPHRRAADGTHGGGKRRHGKRGDDLVVAVPEGTLVRSPEGDLIADLVSPGDRFLAARGGRGGHGNARFLTNRLRAPAFAEQAELGEEKWLDLELELMADVALVGFPNAGKSTLVSRVSAARPKIADYPFTTLVPHLGVVYVGTTRGRRGVVSDLDSSTQFVIADIPGLVEGAATGRGLGHRFLRHVERARVLLVLVDLSPSEGRAPADQLRVLLEELACYRPELVERPRVVVGSRADVLAARSRPDPSEYGGDIEVSAATGEGVDELVGRLATLVDGVRAAHAAPRTSPVMHRPLPEAMGIERDGTCYVVLGRDALRAVALSDLTDADALALAQRRLRRLGVDKALQRAGARRGDQVRIGSLMFEWEPD